MPNTVSTRIYKYKTNTLAVIGIYSFCFFVFLFRLYWMSTEEVLLFGSIFVAIPLYVRYGNNEKMKLRTCNEHRLIFSTDGIDFGEAHYPINELETAAIYLESFTGFEYRELG